MGKPLSEDLRSRLIAAVAQGMSRRAAAERFGVAAATAVRWVHAFNVTGTFAAKPQGGDTRSHRIEVFRDTILAAIEVQKDIALTGLAEMLALEHGARFARSTIWRFLDRHAITVKKTAHASEQGRPDVAARRRAWPHLVISDVAAGHGRSFQEEIHHRPSRPRSPNNPAPW